MCLLFYIIIYVMSMLAAVAAVIYYYAAVGRLVSYVYRNIAKFDRAKFEE